MIQIPLGRPMSIWEDNIKMNIKVTGYQGVLLIQLAPVVGSCEHSDEPSSSIKGREFD
jgi:hypothetical protein